MFLEEFGHRHAGKEVEGAVKLYKSHCHISVTYFNESLLFDMVCKINDIHGPHQGISIELPQSVDESAWQSVTYLKVKTIPMTLPLA